MTILFFEISPVPGVALAHVPAPFGQMDPDLDSSAEFVFSRMYRINLTFSGQCVAVGTGLGDIEATSYMKSPFLEVPLLERHFCTFYIELTTLRPLQ